MNQKLVRSALAKLGGSLTQMAHGLKDAGCVNKRNKKAERSETCPVAQYIRKELNLGPKVDVSVENLEIRIYDHDTDKKISFRPSLLVRKFIFIADQDLALSRNDWYAKELASEGNLIRFPFLLEKGGE